MCPLLLPLLALALLPYSLQKDPLFAKDLPLKNTECNQCIEPPPVTKCTDCEPTILAQGAITTRCSGTLTCLPGRILIANNRFVVTNVHCSDHSSKEEFVWIGTTSSKKQIALENAACFVTPISCIKIGSFSTRCHRGFDCDDVKLNEDESKIWCHRNDWQGRLKDLLQLNVHRKNLWFQDDDGKWHELNQELECDSKLGAWIETHPVNKTTMINSIITDRILCGRKEFSMFGLVIESEQIDLCVTIIQICVPILIIALIGIFKQLRKRAFLKATKEYLDEQHMSGKQKERALKENEKGSMRVLTNRWREVNKFVVEKNKGIMAEIKLKKKGKKKSS